MLDITLNREGPLGSVTMWCFQGDQGWTGLRNSVATHTTSCLVLLIKSEIRQN